MSDFQLTTPVAFIIFNRPDTTERVFAEIARAKPPRLLVVGDGPRPDRQGEAEKVAAARAIIERVDWDCEVLTNFSDVNLGCKRRVSSGLDWVFEQAEEVIILEDDCLPDPTFFRFCQEMLARYRHDQRIGMVTCTNTQFGARRNDDSYYFSKYPLIWGWATWSDRWQESYDVSMADWPRIRDEAWIADLVGNNEEVEYWRNIFDLTYHGKIDTWDYQWFFANWMEGRVCIVPTVNLISNIGWGESATHTTTTNTHLANIGRSQIVFPLSHPPGIFRNFQADRFTDLVYFQNLSPENARLKIANALQKQINDRKHEKKIEKNPGKRNILRGISAFFNRLLFRLSRYF